MRLQYAILWILGWILFIPFPGNHSMTCGNCDSETYAEHHTCTGCGGEWCSHCRNVRDGGCDSCGKMFCRFCFDGNIKCKDCISTGN